METKHMQFKRDIKFKRGTSFFSFAENVEWRHCTKLFFEKTIEKSIYANNENRSNS